MSTKLKYGRENASKIGGITANLTVAAAQQTLNNVIYLRQRMSPEVHAVVNTIGHQRAVTFETGKRGSTGDASSPHAAIAALTEGLAKIAERKLKGTVISVGGTAYDHLNKGWHVCQLDNDGRNAPRFNTYLNQARKASDNPRSTELVADITSRGRAGGDAMCFNGATDCKRAANNLFFNNSHYDITFAELARMMALHGASKAVMIGIHPREMLINELTEYTDIDFHMTWRKMSDNRQPSDKDSVIVGFGDGSNAYRHELGEYLKWIRTTCWSSGHLNLILEVDFWGPLAIIEVHSSTRPATICRYISLEKPIVMFPDFKYYAKYALGTNYHPTTRYHFLDAKIFASLESYAMSKTDPAWTYPTFAGYTKAQATVMTLTDGEWRHYGNQSAIHQLTSDGSVSLFIWLSAQRAARSQLVGRAFNAIADELKSEISFTRAIQKKLIRSLNNAKACLTPAFVDELMRYSKLVEPSLTTSDGLWLVGRVNRLDTELITVPYESAELIDEETNQSTPADGDLTEKAIDEYRSKIAPLELNHAETEINVRPEDDGEVGLYKVVAAATREAIKSEFRRFEGDIEIVEGGPGTGKTQYEAENMLGEDIAFVPTRLAKQELEARLKMLSKMNSVYTNHAGLLYALRDAAGKHKGAKLWLDEAFLQFPGSALLAATALEVTAIVFVGDSKQIRAKDFLGAGTEVLTHHFLKAGKIKELKNNYRNPPQIVEMLNRKFGYDMVAKSKVVGSMETESFDNFDAFFADQGQRRFDNGWRFLTFTQELKNRFINHGYHANSIHEFQGASDRRTAVIVTNDLDQNFLDDLGYFIVGYSRSTEKLLICKVIVADGVEFRQIKVGNIDLEALTDLFSPVACIMATPVERIVELPFGDRNVSFNVNFSMSDIADVFDSYWYAAHPYTHHIRSVYKTRVPTSAEEIRIRPQLITEIENEIDVASFGDYCYLADQNGASALAMIETFITRNGGARILIERGRAMQIAHVVVNRTRKRLFSTDITPLSLDELSLGFERFVRKTLERGKSAHYINAELTNIGRLEAFMKTQLKSKWEATRENFESMYEFAQSDVFGMAMEGKAGQGVIGWSKALCFVFASWINAIEQRYLKELKPWVVYATQLSESETVGKINHILRVYKKCILVKGDDVAIVYTDENGRMRAITWDASKFDSTQASAVMSAQALVMSRYGMPSKLVGYYYNFMEDNHIRSLGRVLEMTLHFCRHSGGYETLWGNTNHSLNMIALCIDIDEAGDWRKARFDKQGLRMMKAALGAELKVKEGDIGDFIGYIIQDYSLRPDIFRLAAKVIGRRFSLGSDVSAAQRENYFADYPELRNARQAGMLSLYHNVAEYQNAVFDRLSTIRTEDDRVKTIRANASYYMPNVAAQEAHAKVGLILDALATFAQRRYTSIYYNELRRRIKRMHFLPIENAADGGDQSHIIMDNESAGRVIEDLRMIDRVVRPVEEYNYVVDDGWRFTLKERIVRAAEAVIRPFWLRLLDAVDARIRRSRFATKLWWLTWLINKVRPKQDDAALEPVAYDDEDEESNQGDANINQALNVEEEDVAGNAALEAAIGIVDYYEATEARVNNCLKADPNCTKIFADFRGVKKYESGAAYKLLDCLTEEQEELFALEGNAVTVCDIGCGPGGCTQVFCEYPGINRVIAINAPHEYPGSVKMRYMNPKIDLRQVDAATLTTLPEADYYFSDIQNLPTNVALEWFGAADDERPIAIKINHLDDNLALALGERACILKPRRSNRYSSEFYLLSYEHPQATTLQQFITNWALAVGDLEARRIPNPYPSVDNELAGRDTRVLSEAFETITQKQRQIRSAVQLADMLKRAGVNFTISQNRQILHENDKGRIGRYWEIDLDLGSVTCVEDQPGKKKVEQVAEEEELTSDDDDLEVDNGADAEHDDFDYEAARQENLVFEAAGRANAAFAPVCRENFSDFEIAVIGPFFEECARSLVIRWTSLHPVAFSHFFGFVRDRMQGINNTADLYSTFMLLGAKRQHFLLRVIHHISQNALFVRVPGLWFKLFSFLRCATQADNITHVILSAIAVGIDFYTGHNFASAATHAIFLTVGFFENIRDCKI